MNHQNSHWTAAAINFKEKRVESYDSMGIAKEKVFAVRISTLHVSNYLDSWSKRIYGLISMRNTWTRRKSLSISQIGKTGPQMFVFFSLLIQAWMTDSVAMQTTPQQENGFDCGVFTCQFLETLSRGEESFRFSQKNMPYLRRRMIWEIGNAALRDDHY